MAAKWVVVRTPGDVSGVTPSPGTAPTMTGGTEVFEQDAGEDGSVVRVFAFDAGEEAEAKAAAALVNGTVFASLAEAKDNARTRGEGQ